MTEHKPRWQEVAERAARRHAKDPRFTKRAWVAVHLRIVELIPAAQEVITGPHLLSPDRVIDAAERDSRLEVHTRVFPNALRDAVALADEWTVWGDEEVFRRVFDGFEPTPGPLWVAAWVGDAPSRVFEAEGDGLFAQLEELGVDFQQDVMCVWRQAARVSLIHHSGAAVHILPLC